jgi:hypothetical protein
VDVRVDTLAAVSAGGLAGAAAFAFLIVEALVP